MTVSLPEKDQPHSPDKIGAPIWRRIAEYSVVLGIIGILMSLLLPPVQIARESSRRSQVINEKRQAEIQALANAKSESPYYLGDEIQYFPPGPEFNLAGEPKPESAPEPAALEIALEEVSDSPLPESIVKSEKRARPQMTIDSGSVPGTGLTGRGASVSGKFNVQTNGGTSERGYSLEYRSVRPGPDADHPTDSFGDEPTNNSEQYDAITDNPFREVKQHPLSTFSIDVDTASYANVRRFLTMGRLPPRNAVRIEELVNYFKFNDPAPKDDAPFSANMEAAPCPWNAEHLLLRVGLKGKEIHRAERPASNLVFLVDVSGSMADQNKLPLLQASLKLMVDQLTENDRVTIVTYAGDTGVRMPPTNGLEKAKIKSVIDVLASGGSTHGSAGIVLAYEQAKAGFIKQGANRVILCTDGDLNVGITRDDELVNLITQQAKSGVFLTVLGFGTGNLKDSKMEKLADHGNGMYAYIDSLKEGRKVLVEQMSGSTVTIAKDVKIQIEFNPSQIGAYRLLGYENRILAAKDFNDDKKDAGEIGAGHSVTALYELVPVGAKATTEEVDPLKYQPTKTDAVKADEPKAEPAALSKELLTLKLRYKQPDADTSKLLTFPLSERKARFSEASSDFRFASSVAAFGMMLRQSPYRGDMKLSGLTEIAASSLGDDANGYRTEFLDLLRRAKELGAN